MVNFADTFFEETGADNKSLMARLERRDFLWRWRSANEIADYFETTHNTHISEWAKKVQSIADTYWKRIEFVVAPPWVMAYVKPGISDTVFYNLFNLLRGDREDSKTIHHEVGHLRQDRVTGNAYEIPGFDRLSEGSRTIIEKRLGMKIEARDLVEWAIEGRTKRTLWKDENCVYHEFEVPLFEKFAKLIQHYTWKNVIPLFDELTPSSTQEMEEIIALWANLMLLEEAALEMGWSLGKPQRLIIFAAGKSLVSNKKDLANIDEAKSTLRWVSIDDDELVLAF